MSVPLFLVPAGELPESGPYLLGGAEGRHAARARRLRPGEPVELADGTGRVARCLVTAGTGDGLPVEIRATVHVPEPQPRFVVAQALPKGDRGELAVELLTELGVDAIVPWAAARCVTVWSGERGERARRRWAAHAWEATKQARRPRVPVVEDLADTPALVRRAAGAALAVVLHEGATEPMAALDLPAGGEVLLIIGPEGGISDDELAALGDAGARIRRLGPEVLRTSTAGPVALAVLSARTSRWDPPWKDDPDD